MGESAYKPLSQSTHVIFGAGLIGSYMATHLLHGFSKARLQIVARSHLHENFTKQLKVTDYAGQSTQVEVTDVLCVDDMTALSSSPDVVWLTVKCTAIAEACQNIKDHIGPDTIIMCCQNGVGSDEIVKQYFPEHTVIRVMVPFNVVLQDVGHWHRSSSGTVTFEAHNNLPDLSIQVKQLETPTMPVAVTDAMSALLWAKCQINLTNSVNALANKSLKETLLDKPYRRLVAKLMLEHLAVCRAQDIELPKITAAPAHLIPRVMQTPDWLFPHLAKQMVAIDPAAKLSMWWDLEVGRLTEVDFINGATARAGREQGIATPINDKVIAMIHRLEQERLNGEPRRTVNVEELYNS